MKIGILTTYFYPFKDGTENQAFYWSSELARKHEVHIFTSDRKEGAVLEKKHEIINGVHIHRYETAFRYRYYLCWNKKMISDLLNADIDILHVHSIGFPQQDFAVFLLKLLRPKLKIVGFPHGPFLANERYNIGVKTLRWIYRIFEKTFVNGKYDAVIDCNGSQKTTWMPKYFPNLEKVFYCPDGIPAERFKKIDKTDFGKKYNLKEKFVIAQLGRLVKYKGQEQVIKILPEIVKKHPEVIFLIMGANRGYKAELEQLAKQLSIEKNTIFTGELSYDDVLRGLDCSQVVCLTSQPGTEAFGIVLLEGMARGCVPISTKIGNGSPAVDHEANGFVYDFDDLESLKKYILRLIEDKTLLKKMRAKSIEKARGFVNENIVWKYLEPKYKELIGVGAGVAK
ncbi:MAG TPA: glycosyltransferase family 4 protein [Nanoarchaeota archaeon]|nr:glycosyltransferase family 4 protein [Nanoarchaeota archaeon]